MDNKPLSATDELLLEMHRNVTRESERLAAVTPYITDKSLLSNVTAQLENYAKFTNTTESLLQRRGKTPPKTSTIKKAASSVGIMLAATFDPSDSHIANIIGKDAKNSAQQLEVTLCNLAEHGADKNAVSLGRGIVNYELTESDKIKDYT